MGSGQSVSVPGGGTEGYHVLRVQDNSPGQRAGLEAFFDFVVAIENTRLDQDNDTLKELLKSNLEKEIRMTVYSSKYQNVREVKITPSATWGGQGLLGVSIRFCSFEGANENVWHILEVHPQSPAEIAGLRGFSDFIIGADSILHESEDLFTLIESHEGRPLKLFVYNTDDDSCREVTIKPFSKWGGEGSLGCGIGYGYLHRIPVRVMPDDKKASQIPEPPISYSKDTSALLANQFAPPVNSNIPVPYVPPLANTFTQFSAPPTSISALSQDPGHVPSASDVAAAISNLNISQQLQGTLQSATTVVSSPSNLAPLISTGVPPPSSIASVFGGHPQYPGAQVAPQNLFQQQPGDQESTHVASPVNQIPMYSPTQFQGGAPPATMQNFLPPQGPLSTAYPFEPPIESSEGGQQQPPFNPALLSYPASAFAAPQAPPSSTGYPPLHTYSTYPQVQGAAGTSVTTPISLPGMPPITVSATLPPQALEGLQFSATPPQQQQVGAPSTIQN